MINRTPNKLTIEYLRGSILPFTLNFEKGKKLTVIYGENGAGKSTICDALEFLGKGKVGSIEKRGLGKTTPYWHSIGKNSSDVSVTLETEISSCKATIVDSEVQMTPPEERPRIEVFRRAQIRSLIEANHSDQYEAIKRFIDVSEIETCESSLRDTIREVQESLSIALARIEENRQSLEHFWEEAGKPGKKPTDWAKNEQGKNFEHLKKEAVALEQLQQKFDRLSVFPGYMDQAQARLINAIELVKKSQIDVDECVKSITGEAPETVAVLEAMKEYLSVQPNPSACPACGSAQNVVGLSERVSEKLDAFEGLRQKQALKKNAEEEFRESTRAIDTVQQQAKTASVEFEKAVNSVSLPVDTVQPKAPLPKELVQWSVWLKTNSNLPQVWKQAENSRRDSDKFFNTLKRVFNTWEENFLAGKDLAEVLAKTQEALAIVEKERKKFTNLTLTSIANEVGRLYEEVHPGEGLNKISIALDPDRRASLEIGASILGLSGAPPQAYFSDSHLDTLGLCIFLALASLEKPEENILVLDDILGSVDEPHVDRLIEMLYQESLKFCHCIITTHYRPWKQKLRWGWLKIGQCHFIELTRWTPKSGINVIHAVPDVERLRQLFLEHAPDLQLICAKSGVILEAELDFLTQVYECHVPRRANGVFTLGELIQSIDKKLRKALSVDVLTGKNSDGSGIYNSVPLEPILDELTRIAQARNIFGCHFSAISFEFLDSDALDFGQNVLKLTEALIDDDAGWPKNGKSGNFWATAGETRRLHPYARPT